MLPAVNFVSRSSETCVPRQYFNNRASRSCAWHFWYRAGRVIAKSHLSDNTCKRFILRYWKPVCLRGTHRSSVRQAGLGNGSLVIAWQSRALFVINRNRSRRIKSNFARRRISAPHFLHLQMSGSWNPRRKRTRAVELSSREFPPIINF